MNGNKPKNESMGQHHLEGSIFDLILDINPKNEEKNSNLFNGVLTFFVNVFIDLTMLQHVSAKIIATSNIVWDLLGEYPYYILLSSENS